jgi:hypothetical protein
MRTPQELHKQEQLLVQTETTTKNDSVGCVNSLTFNFIIHVKFSVICFIPEKLSINGVSNIAKWWCIL